MEISVPQDSRAHQRETVVYSISEGIARILIPRVDHFFGLMGNGNAWFVDALDRLGHGIIPVRHEVASVAAADAYHRVSRRLAVATTTYFRRQVTSGTGSCATASSNAVILTVRPVLTAGSTGTDQAVCAGATPAPFTSLSGASGPPSRRRRTGRGPDAGAAPAGRSGALVAGV